MAKYRLLTSTELGALEQDFVKFLVLNGISGDDWVEMKNTDVENIEKLISLFSDVVFDEIVRKTCFIEFHDSSGLKLFMCGDDQIKLISLQRIDQYPFDYGNKALLLAELKANPSYFGTYTASKEYKPSRGIEVFRMIESGGIVSDGGWFEIFEKMGDTNSPNAN